MSSSTKPKVYMPDLYHQDGQDMFKAATTITPILPSDPQVGSWREDADALIIRSETKLGEADFAAAKKLKLVVKQGVGYDNIDVEAAKKHGVAVYITPGINSEAVAEMALALGLTLARRITEYDRSIRSNSKIVRSKMLGTSLFEKKVGIIGMGNIGKIAAQKWIGAVSANIIAYDPIVKPEAWAGIPHTRAETVNDVVSQADVITLHLPLLPTTRNIIGEKEFEAMKPNAIVINTARGGLVDEKALAKVLKTGKLWGAALDVLEQEPPMWDTHSDLLESGKVILTPHVGGSTHECQSLIATAAVKSLLAALAGESDIPGKVV